MPDDDRRPAGCADADTQVSDPRLLDALAVADASTADAALSDALSFSADDRALAHRAERVVAALRRATDDQATTPLPITPALTFQAAFLLGLAAGRRAIPLYKAPPPRQEAVTASAGDRFASQVYLRCDEAAEYLRFPSVQAFWSWAKRQGLRAHKVGRINLYRRTVLERWAEEGPVPVRRRLVSRPKQRTGKSR